MRTPPPEVLGFEGMPGDEELGDDRRWWAVSTRQVIGTVAVVGTLVGLIVAGHLGGHAPQAAPTPQVSTTQDPNREPFSQLSLNEVALRCPPTIACTSVETVPEATLAAVQEYLPGSSARRTLSIDRFAPNRLYYRAVNVAAGLVELLVIVSPPDAAHGDQTVTLDPHPGAAIRYSRRITGDYEIQVQYTGPPGKTPAADLAQRLAADPRLLADR